MAFNMDARSLRGLAETVDEGALQGGHANTAAIDDRAWGRCSRRTGWRSPAQKPPPLDSRGSWTLSAVWVDGSWPSWRGRPRAKGEESCNALIARTSKPSSIIERDDGKVKNRSSSRLTSRLSGDQKSFGKNIEETGEQEANLKDSSFNQKNEKDVSTMMSKTEFVEVMNEKIEDESEKLLKKNCSDDRINVE